MKKYLLFIPTIILFFGCDLSSDCDDLLYEIGPPGIYVELIDEATEENIFTNGSYVPEDIQISHDHGENISFTFISENNYNIISFVPFSFVNEPYGFLEKNTIFIEVGETIKAKITFDIIEISSECNSYRIIKNMLVENYPYELDNATEILKIKV